MSVKETKVLDETRSDPSLRPYQRILPSPQSRSELRQQGYTWVLSSNVSGVAERNDNLYIRFHNGSVYEYPNRGGDFEEIINAPSKGRWVWNNLRRTNASYRKVGELPLEEDVDVSDEDIVKPPKLLTPQELATVKELMAQNLKILESSEMFTLPILES